MHFHEVVYNIDFQRQKKKHKLSEGRRERGKKKKRVNMKELVGEGFMYNFYKIWSNVLICLARIKTSKF